MGRTKIRLHPFSSDSSRRRSRAFSFQCASRAESEDVAKHFGLRAAAATPEAAAMEGGQEEAYNQDDATGFIALNALRLKATARQGK